MRSALTDARGATVTSGAPAGTVYDEAVSREVVARLQPLLGMDDAQVAELVDAVQGLHEADGIGAVLRLVRESAPR